MLLLLLLDSDNGSWSSASCARVHKLDHLHFRFQRLLHLFGFTPLLLMALVGVGWCGVG